MTIAPATFCKKCGAQGGLAHFAPCVGDDEGSVPYLHFSEKPGIDFGKPDVIAQADAYLAARNGTYDYRARRYRAAGDLMVHTLGLENTDTVYDIGAAMTELDVSLRVDFGWKGRYIPVDACIDGTDLEHWTPPRRAEWFVALEIIEHLDNASDLVGQMQANANKGVILTTPNPDVVDVLAIDPTHKTVITRDMLHVSGFTTELTELFGKDKDTILAYWTREN